MPSQTEQSNELTVLGTYNGTAIMARTTDRYVDVTAMCQAAGKEWRAYAQTTSAKRFIEAITDSITITDAVENPLIITTRDAHGAQAHTFADRRVALHCAGWISPAFEVWVYSRIEELMLHGKVSLSSAATEAPSLTLSLQTLRQLTQLSNVAIEAMNANPGALSGARLYLATLLANKNQTQDSWVCEIADHHNDKMSPD